MQTRERKRPAPVSAASRAEVIAAIGAAPPLRARLIEALHAIQDRYGHLSHAHLAALADLMKLAPAEVFEVATFYHHFDVVRDGEPVPPPLTVGVCDSISCAMAGAEGLIATLKQTLGSGVRVRRVPCVGRCERAPVAVVGWNPIGAANAASVHHAVAIGATEARIPDVIGYGAYRSGGGYRIYDECLAGKRTPDQLIAELDRSALRGLGGAGFPAGRKWRVVREQSAPRLLAVNVDEGEPGTFKDRYYLERDPHRFLEGMLIAGWAVACEAITIYVRDEYAGCRRMLAGEIGELRSAYPDAPAIDLRRGAGAYVCGEESAMIESIEGKRGIPRLRPPYVAEVGAFGRPTLQHNMETLYWIPTILEKGAEWFASHGRRGRRGLRSFSVSGRVAKPGVHLAPAGITLRELIDEFCGKMLPGHELYGYFPGGASGGILPASLADVPLDFDTLAPYGCFIGSAAIIVLSQRDSARDAALNAMRFFAHESCGKCTPCRVGTAKAAELMACRRWDVPLLLDLARTMADASICGLGQAAANPLSSVIRYFSHELGQG